MHTVIEQYCRTVKLNFNIMLVMFGLAFYMHVFYMLFFLGFVGACSTLVKCIPCCGCKKTFEFLPLYIFGD